MGACFTCEIFDGKLNISELRKRYDARINELLYEHGADAYNGTLTTTSGLIIDDNKTFDSRHAAEEYVMDNTQKWQEARAVKFNDTRNEVTKAPTYNGKPASIPLHIDSHALRVVDRVWDKERATYTVLAADALPASTKATAVALYSDWQTKNKALELLHKSVREILGRMEPISSEPPTTAQFRELQKVIKQRLKANSAAKKAADKLIAFDIKHTPKIYAIKLVDRGPQWLVGGWAAE